MSAPMSAARLAEIRRIRGGPMLRECVAEIERLKLQPADDEDLTPALAASVNEVLMRRLDALEADVKRLKGKVAYLEGATSA